MASLSPQTPPHQPQPQQKKRRAITVYVDDQTRFHVELRVLCQCFVTLDLAPTTDLVVFAAPSLLAHASLASVWSTPGVLHIGYRAMNGAPYHYPFLNSLAYLTTPEALGALHDYEFVMRTDTDIYLTSRFCQWFPEPGQLCVGKGAYCHDRVTTDHLRAIAESLSFNYRDRHNLGSTWYGRTADVIEAGQWALQATYACLAQFERGTTPLEKLGEWPSWYRGVCLLYGSELALNHWEAQQSSAQAEDCRRREVVSDGTQLDSESSSKDLASRHAHVHCWHTRDVFSKFVWQERGYTRQQGEAVVARYKESPGGESVRDYCLRLAYEACPELFPPSSTLSQ